MPDDNGPVISLPEVLPMPSAVVIAAMYLATLVMFEELGLLPIAIHLGTLLAPALRGMNRHGGHRRPGTFLR
jgi:hypothetical protein